MQISDSLECWVGVAGVAIVEANLTSEISGIRCRYFWILWTMWRWFGGRVHQIDRWINPWICRFDESQADLILPVNLHCEYWKPFRCISISVPSAAWSDDFLQSRIICVDEDVPRAREFWKFWNKIIAGYERRAIFQPKLALRFITRCVNQTEWKATTHVRCLLANSMGIQHSHVSLTLTRLLDCVAG